mmetsp:Transcript_88/g.207  ORF Transcript_88/g.207 Transcript_88/m.207 type:complete len:315 (-) Transcript_88:635-1579(-)
MRAPLPAGTMTVLMSGVAMHPRAAPRSPMERDTPWLSPEDEKSLSLLKALPLSSRKNPTNDERRGTRVCTCAEASSLFMPPKGSSSTSMCGSCLAESSTKSTLTSAKTSSSVAPPMTASCLAESSVKSSPEAWLPNLDGARLALFAAASAPLRASRAAISWRPLPPGPLPPRPDPPRPDSSRPALERGSEMPHRSSTKSAWPIVTSTDSMPIATAPPPPRFAPEPKAPLPERDPSRPLPLPLSRAILSNFPLPCTLPCSLALGLTPRRRLLFGPPPLWLKSPPPSSNENLRLSRSSDSSDAARVKNELGPWMLM